jgi:hypothetical protein
MAAIAHNPAFAKKVGVPQSVGREFSNADKGKTFKKGGDTMASKMDPKMMAVMMKARKPKMPVAGMSEPGTPAMMKKGGKIKKMAIGGEAEDTGAYTGSRLNMPSNTRLGKLNAADTRMLNKADNSEYGRELAKARAEGIIPRMTRETRLGIASKAGDTMPGSEYKKGGMTHSEKSEMKSDIAQDKAMIKKAIKQHDEQEHKGGKGTKLKLAKGGSFRSAANGVAKKGLTKGTMVKMAKGGRYC